MARQVNNASVARDELELVGELKDLGKHDNVWQARFENGVLNFQAPHDIVANINVLHMYTESDITHNDTIVINLTFEF